MLHLLPTVRIHAIMNANSSHHNQPNYHSSGPQVEFCVSEDSGGSPNEQFRCNEVYGVDLYVLS